MDIFAVMKQQYCCPLSFTACHFATMQSALCATMILSVTLVNCVKQLTV